jgi:hypothetical protein
MLKTLVILALSSMSLHAGLDKLAAISMIETGDNDSAIGRAGEVSRYQIKPVVWHQYTDSNAYRDPRMSARVAAQHLEQLETVFRTKTGREPTDFDRYVMWNGGMTYYASVKFSPKAVKAVIRERANRYVNLRKGNATSSGVSLAVIDLSPKLVAP